MSKEKELGGTYEFMKFMLNLNCFQKKIHQKEHVLKHEDEILKLKCALESQIVDHASLMSDKLCYPHNLEEKID